MEENERIGEVERNKRNEEVKENRRIIEMEENERKEVLGVRETRRWRKM